MKIAPNLYGLEMNMQTYKVGVTHSAAMRLFGRRRIFSRFQTSCALRGARCHLGNAELRKFERNITAMRSRRHVVSYSQRYG